MNMSRHDPASLRAGCRKVSDLGFLLGNVLISVQLYYISSKSLFININKTPTLKKYNIAAQKSQCDQGEIVGHSICGSLLAEKPDRAKVFFKTYFTW